MSEDIIDLTEIEEGEPPAPNAHANLVPMLPAAAAAPPPDPPNAALGPEPWLEDAIAGLSEARLRTILHAVCAQNGDAARICAELIFELPNVAEEDDGAAPGGEAVGDQLGQFDHIVEDALPVIGQVRQRPRLIWCKNCKEQFLDDDDDDEACTFHPGRLKVNWKSDTWADWDEDAHGQINSDHGLRENPKGYTYTCCREDGNAEGCVTQNHEEDERGVPGRIRRRYH